MPQTRLHLMVLNQKLWKNYSKPFDKTAVPKLSPGFQRRLKAYFQRLLNCGQYCKGHLPRTQLKMPLNQTIQEVTKYQIYFFQLDIVGTTLPMFLLFSSKIEAWVLTNRTWNYYFVSDYIFVKIHPFRTEISQIEIPYTIYIFSLIYLTLCKVTYKIPRTAPC